MLSLSSKKYYIPIKVTSDEGEVVWKIQRIESNDYIVASEFKYVGFVRNREGVALRMSFTYNGSSVRPDGRTLRKYGPDTKTAEVPPSFELGYLVSRLSSNEWTFYNFVEFLKVLMP